MSNMNECSFSQMNGAASFCAATCSSLINDVATCDDIVNLQDHLHDLKKIRVSAGMDMIHHIEFIVWQAQHSHVLWLCTVSSHEIPTDYFPNRGVSVKLHQACVAKRNWLLLDAQAFRIQTVPKLAFLIRFYQWIWAISLCPTMSNHVFKQKNSQMTSLTPLEAEQRCPIDLVHVLLPHVCGPGLHAVDALPNKPRCRSWTSLKPGLRETLQEKV